MPPVNPSIRKLDSSRISVSSELISASFPEFKGSQTLRVFPLAWYRETNLPNRHALEAWLICSTTEFSDEWIVEPNEVSELAAQNPKDYLPVSNLQFSATLEPNNRSWRISCAGLFTDLGILSDGKVWIAQELNGVSVWTVRAFQISMGRIPLD